MENKMAEKRNILGGAIASRLNSPIMQKIEDKLFFVQQTFSRIKYKKAFSVAEAMIALLIGTIVLGFSAPMISKQMKHNNFNAIQYEMLSKKIEKLNNEINTLKNQNIKLESGMVVAFNDTTCPTGWTKLTELFTDSEGVFIRNIGGQALSKGEIQEDAAPNITGTFGSLRTGGYFTSSGVFSAKESKNSYNGLDQVDGTIVEFNAKNASSSYGRDNTIEIRPKNIAFLYCVKD